MNSFGLLRTNVGLTTNIKIMVDSDYNLSMDSIDSKSDLSISKLKKVQFNKKNYWDELIKYFFDKIPVDTAYHIKYEDDEEIMNSNFASQYDEIYQYGARNISNNKNYKEEFEYFAPLWIEKGKLPKYFIIFRIDGPGVLNVNKNNFKSEILQKMKVVKIFDLTSKTNLGEWLDTNFSSKNTFFPNSPLEMDFRQLEFCRWNGINFESGGYVSNSLFIDDILDEEKEIFELEKFIFDKFKDLKVVIANMLNFSFLFDDEPSTPDFKRKWSLNRYLGFYLEEMELVKTFSPYIPPAIKSSAYITDGNILLTNDDLDPFVDGWNDKMPFYVEYNGQYYKVEKTTQSLGNKLTKNKVPVQSIGGFRNRKVFNVPKYQIEEFSEVSVTRYKIISDTNLKDKQNLLNKNSGFINTASNLLDYNGNPFMFDGFDDADAWLIEINGIFHKLAKVNGYLKIISDYSFSYDVNKFEYKVAGVSTSISTVVDFNNSPKKYSIYRLKFSDIKDFDDRIVDTEFSKFEYEKRDSLTLTDEPKMYFTNLNSDTNPPSLDDFVYNGKVVNIPVSSEYTANQETFKIERDKLTNLWRKNPEHCRWCYQNSLSSNDYPYLLNNSMVMEDFNKTTNTYEVEPKRIERNLDYFYTVNSSTSSYVYHSLHVCGYTSSSIDTSFRFELNKYLESYTYSNSDGSYITYSFDYFSNFFSKKAIFDSGRIVKNSKKYSILNKGDNVIPNLTLFKGIKFFVYDVDSIKKSDSGELDINLKNSNSFEDYKFSILLSDNDWSVDDSGKVIQSANGMNWTTIDEWIMDKTYPVGSIGIFDDILYISQIETTITLPAIMIGNREVKASPHTTIEWEYLNMTYSIFWNPVRVYDENTPDNDIIRGGFYNYIVYNSGEYYSFNNSGVYDFWNPQLASTTGYMMGDIVLYKNQYYQSTISENNLAPDYTLEERMFDVWQRYWNPVDEPSNPKWKPIELWNPSKKYRIDSAIHILTVHDGIVYRSIQNNTDEEPGISNKWERLYSMEPDTKFIYKNEIGGNPIIHMNNKYYLINSNTSNSTLDNGIIIYINKKWKNILVNINIADNTLQNISNSDRDALYTDINKKLTANNFILAINDIRNKYGFTDYVTYVVIDESGKISKYNYDLNITNLPCMIICETAEELDVKVNSLTYKGVQLEGDLSAKKVLNDGLIKSLPELNYFNNTPVGSIIIENKFEPKVFENLHGNRNILTNRIYRFTGNYTPLFYDIELFQKNYESSTVGNYKFDTNLSNFGIMKERRISKVNRNGSILKLKDSKLNRPIYPMLDEFGYTIDDFFIFSSTWDLGYHVETSSNDIVNKDVKPFTRAEMLKFDMELEEFDRDRIKDIGNNNMYIDTESVPTPSALAEQVGRPNVDISTSEDEIDFTKLPRKR